MNERKTVCSKVSKELLKKIDKRVRNRAYLNRSEYLRLAIREKIERESDE